MKIRMNRLLFSLLLLLTLGALVMIIGDVQNKSFDSVSKKVDTPLPIATTSTQASEKKSYKNNEQESLLSKTTDSILKEELKEPTSNSDNQMVTKIKSTSTSEFSDSSKSDSSELDPKSPVSSEQELYGWKKGLIEVDPNNLSPELKAVTDFGSDYAKRLDQVTKIHDLNEEEIVHVMNYLSTNPFDESEESITGPISNSISQATEESAPEVSEQIPDKSPEAVDQTDLNVTSLEDQLSSLTDNTLSEEDKRKLQDNLAENSIRNDLLEVLLNIFPMPENLGEMLLDIVKDPEQSPVWKDYVVQHYSVYVQNYVAQTDDLKGVEPFRHSYLNLVEQEKSIAATSLIGMELLYNAGRFFDKNNIVHAAQKINASKNVPPGAKATAQSILINMDIELDFEQSKQLALSNDEALATRFSAIHHLGYGGANELNFLVNLKANLKDGYLLPAINNSINKLNSNGTQ